MVIASPGCSEVTVMPGKVIESEYISSVVAAEFGCKLHKFSAGKDEPLSIAVTEVARKYWVVGPPVTGVQPP